MNENGIPAIKFNANLGQRNQGQVIHHSNLNEFAILDAMDEALILVDEDLQVIFSNKEACRLFRLIEPQPVDLLLGKLLPIKQKMPTYREIITSAETEGKWIGDLVIQMSEDFTLHVSCLAKPFTEKQSSQKGFLFHFKHCIADNISSSHNTDSSSPIIEADAALRDSEERYRTVVENVGEGVLIADLEEQIIYTNQAADCIFGVDPGELIGRKVIEFVDDKGKELIHQQTRMRQQGKTSSYEIGIRRPDNSFRELIITASPLQNAAGLVTQGVGIFRDITDQKKAERSLLESENRYRLLAENITDVIWIRDLALNFTYLSPSVERLSGYPLDEAMRLSVEETLAPESLNKVRKHIAEKYMLEQSGLLDPDSVLTLELDHLHKDGSIIFTETKVSFLRDEDGTPTGFLGVSRDITKRKKSEEQQQKLITLIETSEEFIGLANMNGESEYINEAGLQMCGLSSIDDLENLSISNFVPEDFVDQLQNQIFPELHRTGHSYGEFQLKHFKTGERIFVDFHTFLIRSVATDEPTNIAVVLRDISLRKQAEEEKKRLEEQLLQAQKMEAIGTLAGGVAHDFNNIITGMLGYVEFVQENLKTDDPLLSDILEIKSAGNRAATLTKQLLAFSRKQIIQPKVIDIHQLLTDSMEMLGKLVSANISLDYNPDQESSNALIDPYQMEQILTNLVVNASEAMPSGGKITLKASSLEIGPHDSLKCMGIKPGNYIELTVSDTGLGMAPETIQHIFEPFFTTKGRANNSGLGLATVYGILRQNKGGIHVESTPGKGSVFSLYLPLAVPQNAITPPEITEDQNAKRETILLVEDEQMVRKLAKRILVREGYKVFDAEKGDLALRIAEENNGGIDLLLTDVVMPDMNGGELFDKVREACPGCQVLYMSGYAEESIAQFGVSTTNVPFIQKPFKLELLIQTVQNALKAR